ncbi:hypothetical protein BSKO_06420 [Bryopsis sp. KO-2023]|nr:hypothetical protein BSKO_06420 [Bryopsis sp. KO-2023]
MSVITGGDEVNAVVIDVGSGSTRVGYAGEDTPKAVYPSFLGVATSDGDAMEVENGGMHPDSQGKKFHTGFSSLSHRKDNMEVVSPFGPECMFEDMDRVEALWDHAFKDRLRLHPEEHPMLVCEPSNNPPATREKLVELAFEKYNPPAVFLARNAVLSSFATGRQTSLLVDSGYKGTTVAAVHDGYVLLKSVTWTPLGGALLTECMRRCVDPDATLMKPRYAFKKVERSPGMYEVEPVETPLVRDSYRRYCINQISADLKESICRVADSTFVEGENSNIPTVSYELPDGAEIQVGPDRFKVPEVLFQPDLLSTFPGTMDPEFPSGVPSMSLPGIVVECINKCDVDIRRELYNGAILTGGTSLFSQMRERLEKELVDLAPQAVKVKVMQPVNATERRFSVWIGGSILASLGSFQQMWMSKMEYEEQGTSLIHRRAP